MKKIYCLVLIFVLMAAAAIIPAAGQTPQPGQMPQSSDSGLTGKSHNNTDFISIAKITPRTAADVPIGSQFPVTMEAASRLKSMKSGIIKARAFIWAPGAKSGKASYKKGLTPVSKVLSARVSGGDQKVKFTFPMLKMPAAPLPQTQLVIVASLQTPAGKELAWGSSYNFVRGKMFLTKTAAKTPRDAMVVLSFSPKTGELAVGRAHQFSYRFQYSLKSRETGFVSFELRNALDAPGVGPWHSAIIPVPRGAGIVKYVSDKYFFPYVRRSLPMRLHVLYRIDPLGIAHDNFLYGDWSLQAP